MQQVQKRTFWMGCIQNFL